MADKKEILDDSKVIGTSDGQKQRTTSISEGVQNRITRISSIFMVLISGLALFSDGFNAQIIGYMNPLFKELYPDAFSSTIKTRLSNAYLIGEIFGMLFFGYTIQAWPTNGYFLRDDLLGSGCHSRNCCARKD